MDIKQEMTEDEKYTQRNFSTSEGLEQLGELVTIPTTIDTIDVVIVV